MDKSRRSVVLSATARKPIVKFKMKFTLVLTFVILSVCLNNAFAGTQRLKRAVSQAKCPENATTKEACEAYVAEQIKLNPGCYRGLVSGGSIEWQSCGVVGCGGGLKLADEDLSKPYPECCAECVPIV